MEMLDPTQQNPARRHVERRQKCLITMVIKFINVAHCRAIPLGTFITKTYDKVTTTTATSTTIIFLNFLDC